MYKKDRKLLAKDILEEFKTHKNITQTQVESIPAVEIGATRHTGVTKSRKIPILEILPSQCKPWKHHDRDQAWLCKEKCQDLITSISKNGQMEPGLVRILHDDPQYSYEIIYGVRRWYACSQIPNQKFLAKVSMQNDKQCMVLMHSENADSKDISEFETL